MVFIKLSVIICLYNTKKEYFKQCMASIYSSSLKDYEVIVIDDGSDIDYSDILNRYKPRYVKTENRGIMAARLYGIALADGEYVSFFDSDDTVSFNYHNPMIEEAERTGADLVINDWAFHTERARYFCKKDVTVSTDFTLQKDEILKAYVENEGRQHSFFTLWNKIFKKEIILKAKREIEKLREPKMRIIYGEDVIINFFAFKNAAKLTNIHTGYYFYRIQPEQSVNVTSPGKLKNQIYSMSYAIGIMRENIGENKYASEIDMHIEKWGGLMARSHYSHAKEKKYFDLYPYILQSYGVDKLRSYTYKDGIAYTDNELLPENFDEIDNALKFVYDSKVPIDLDYNKKDAYVVRTLEYLNKYKEKITAYSKDAEFKIPNSRVNLKNKILHNYYIYTLGMIFFKKGSRIREFLKRKI